MPYIRKPEPVEAFQWLRDSDRKDWPQWAQDFEGELSLGSTQKLGMSGIGTLLVPIAGQVKNANPGDFIVQISKTELAIYPPAKFAELYDDVDAQAPEAGAPVVSEPEPVAAVAEEAKPAAKGRAAAPKADAPAEAPVEPSAEA